MTLVSVKEPWIKYLGWLVKLLGVTRSILDGEFNPLVFWYQWDSHTAQAFTRRGRYGVGTPQPVGPGVLAQWMKQLLRWCLSLQNCAWSPWCVCASYGMTTVSACPMLYLWIKLEFRLKAMSWMTHYLRQTFLDMNLSECGCAPEARCMSRWWSPMRSGIRLCLKIHNVFCWVRWLTGDFELCCCRGPECQGQFSLLDLEGLCLGNDCLVCAVSRSVLGWCSPWSSERSEGMSKVSAMFFAALLRSGVMFSENVSNFKAHKSWNLLHGLFNGWTLEARGIFPLIVVMRFRRQMTEQSWFGLTDRIWIPLEQNRSGGPVSGCILWGPLVWLVLGTAMDRMCNATRCCPSAVAKTNLWHVFVSFLTRSCAFTSVECAVFVCIWVAQPLAIAARGCCVLRWHAVRLAVSMGLSTNQLRIRFFAEYLRLALGILPNSLWIMNTHSREIVNQHSNNQLVQWDGWRGSNPIHTL